MTQGNGVAGNVDLSHTPIYCSPSPGGRGWREATGEGQPRSSVPQTSKLEMILWIISTMKIILFPGGAFSPLAGPKLKLEVS